MAELDLQSLGMRLGEAITPTPRDAPQVRYGTIDTVNADGTLDVTIDGTTLRGMCATTGCVGAQAGMRCVVLRQGALATVVGLIASTDLGDITLPDGDINANGDINATVGMRANWLSVNGGTATIASDGYATVGTLRVNGDVNYNGASAMKDASDTTARSLANNTWTSRASITLGAGTWVIVGTCQFQNNATGRRGLNISIDSGSSATSAAEGLQIPAASGAQTVISRAWIQTFTASTTYHLNVFQNSGSSLTTYAYLRAVRVA